MGLARNRAPAFGVFIDDITVGTGTIRASSADIRYSADSDAGRDQVGEIDQRYFYNNRREITITFFPQGATASDARSASALNASVGQKLQPGKSLTISNAVDTDLNRVWIIEASRKVARTDARTEYTIDLTAHETHGANIGANEIAV